MRMILLIAALLLPVNALAFTKTYNVSVSFNFQGFLDACRTGGLKLSALNTGEQVHGHVSLRGGVLEVVIAEASSGREELAAIGLVAAEALSDASVTANNP